MVVKISYKIFHSHMLVHKVVGSQEGGNTKYLAKANFMLDLADITSKLIAPMTSGAIFFKSSSGLEHGITLIQSQVFVVLSCSYEIFFVYTVISITLYFYLMPLQRKCRFYRKGKVSYLLILIFEIDQDLYSRFCTHC
jgi:hypothetical protein